PSWGTVERKRSASGPSRMLARLRRAMCQDLLGQLTVVLSRVSLRIVLEHAGAPDRCLGELDRLADTLLEDELAEVLLEDHHRLLGVDRPRVEHRREDTLVVHSRVQVLADHLERVLELDE